MRTAAAYYNWGRWIVDCPEPGCTDARAVYHPTTGARQTHDVCANGHPIQIDMPPPPVEAQIGAVLSERAVEADRSWYPTGHRRAVLSGLPTGQSVKELAEENRKVSAYRTAQRQHEQARVRELLADLGVTVGPDGRFEGKI